MSLNTRTQVLHDVPLREGEYVLYWMTSARRTGWSFALDRATELARQLKKPLVVFEALDAQAPWASERIFRFMIDGMQANAAHFRSRGVCAWPYIAPDAQAAKATFEGLCRRACVLIADISPVLHLPNRLQAAARFPLRVEAIDSNGLLPLSLGGAFPTAYAFRRHIQKTLPAVLSLPQADPLVDLPPAPPDLLPAPPPLTLPAFTRAISPLALRGGEKQGRALLQAFLPRLSNYAETRNESGGSGLSPYLHFGHTSVYEVFATVTADWSIEKLAKTHAGKRAGWWGLPPSTEAFLDQIVTWRELGYQFCHHRPDYAQYESLPEWALKTLEKHASDPRPYCYSFEQLDQGLTHDTVWNAAQQQLRQEGVIHNYLRMLWGKKVLEWSTHPREAFQTLIELNNRYALDGRDPNSYSGIAWTLGRFDRAWGPERPIFGTIRYMSSANTLRKLDLDDYLDTYK